MANVENAVSDLYGSNERATVEKRDRRMTEHSRKWSSSGLGLDAAEAEARRLEKKGTFSATMDDEAGTVTLSKDDFKAVMSKLGGHKEVAKRSRANLVLLAFGYLAVSVGFIAVIVGLMNWRIEATKESRVTDSELVGKNGKVVASEQSAAFVTLMDIPKMGTEYLSKLSTLSYVFKGTVVVVKVESISTKNSSSALIQLVGGDSIVVKCGTARVYKGQGDDFPIREYDLKEENNAGVVRRMLVEHHGEGKRAFTLSELTYTAEKLFEIEAASGRALKEKAAPLTNLYSFFGGVASSRVSARTANSEKSMHKLLDDSNCVKFRNEIYQPIIPKNALFDMEMDDDNDDATTTDKVQAYMYLAATTDGTLKMRTEFLTNPRNRIDVQEWHSGSEYTYSMIDVDGLIASTDKTQFVCPPPANLTAAGTTCADWQTVAAQNQIDGFKAKKEEKVGCKVNAETVDEDAAESAADAATLVKHNADGSSVWRVGGWVLKVNKERTPVAILEPETDKVLFKIKSVTEFNAGVLNTHFKGCNPITDGADTRNITVPSTHTRRLSEMTKGEIAASRLLDSMVAGHLGITHDHLGRKLSINDLSAFGTRTMWCGPGSVNGCCPGDSTDNGCKKKLKTTYGYDDYDMAADFVCRRHDSGGYSHPVDVFGTTIPRAPCNMDRDIAEGIQNDNAGGTPWLTNKFIIDNVVFGRTGLYGIVGCLDKITHIEWYKRHHCRCKWGRCFCWHTWHLRNVVREEARFGPLRYPLLKFAHHMYTYHGGSPDCPGDLCWQGKGCGRAL